MNIKDALYYEVGSSFWARHLSWAWAQGLAASYYAWKTNLKWKRSQSFNAAVERNRGQK